MAPGGPEQVPGWLMIPTGSVGQPTNHLDLRFPMFGGHMALRAYVFQRLWALGRFGIDLCKAKSPKAKFRVTPPLG